MKKLLLLTIILASCSSQYKTTYTFKVRYTEGTKVKTAYTNDIQWLENGCLGLGDRVVCGNYNVTMVK